MSDNVNLRDYFAAAALGAMIARTTSDNATDMAKNAYIMADAMLEMRNNPPAEHVDDSTEYIVRAAIAKAEEST